MTTLVFATASYEPMARDLALHLGAEQGLLERRTFPDGERYLRLKTPASGHHVVLVAGTISDLDTLEAFDLGCGLVHDGAQSLTLVVPYFGYSTMDRAARPGEVVTAKSRARLLSAITTARGGNRLLVLEVHSEGLPYYFEGDLAATGVAADDVLLAMARREGGTDFVLASADAGRAKRVQTLANVLGVRAGFVLKHRVDDRHTETIAVSADVAGRHVIIYDDMIRTGTSLLAAARAYRDAGAARITAIATHGLLPDDALAQLRDSGLFARICCTDSHPRARQLASDFLHVDPVADLLAKSLKQMP